MTSEMAFECLFVSRDPGVFKVFTRLLRDFSISTNICLTSSRASEFLEKSTTDLIVIDWEGDNSLELLRKIWHGRNAKKPTVVAVTSSDCTVPGVHVVLKKPVTMESGRKSLKTAYCKMLVDHRRHARYALMLPVIATRDDGEALSITVLDIGDGGIGLTTKEAIHVGDVLSFRLQLPNTPRDVLVHIRVLWTNEYGRSGCEFLRIPPVDLVILHDWLIAKQQIKKPINMQ